jgi:hypothetical protein
MSNIDELIKEFEVVSKRYFELYKELVSNKIPGVIDPSVNAACNVGEWCCTGTERSNPMDRIILTALKKQG